MAKNNVLIAEYVHRRGKENKHLFYFYDEQTSKAWHTEDELQYHNNWNWLMKAAEKCVCSGHEDETGFDLHTHAIQDALWTFNIDDVYKAVINYINWENETIISRNK